MVDQRNGEWSTNKTQNGRCTKGLKPFSFWDYCQSSNPAQAVIPTCAEPESGLPWMNLTNNVNCYTMALQYTHTPPTYLNMFSSDARNLEKVHTTYLNLSNFIDCTTDVSMWTSRNWWNSSLFMALWNYYFWKLFSEFIKCINIYLCIYLFIYLFIYSFFLSFFLSSMLENRKLLFTIKIAIIC